jgi:hypothetical protein
VGVIVGVTTGVWVRVEVEMGVLLRVGAVVGQEVRVTVGGSVLVGVLVTTGVEVGGEPVGVGVAVPQPGRVKCMQRLLVTGLLQE